MTDATSEVTYSARYTSWGDTLETYGTGNLAFGYYGGVMDAATGLLYVGNGQYYDPATGRFLTRSTKPNQNNPYTPFDPMGALFAPLGLMALVYGRKKKGSKWAVLLVILSFAVVTGLTLSGCGNDNPPVGEFTATGTLNPVVGTATGTATFSDGTTVSGTIVVTPGAPLPIPTACATPTPTQPPMPITEEDRGLYISEIAEKYNIHVAPGDSLDYVDYALGGVGWTPSIDNAPYTDRYGKVQYAKDTSVFVTAALFDFCNSDDCTAGIIAHEATHSWIELKVEQASITGKERGHDPMHAAEEMAADIVAIQVAGDPNGYLTTHYNDFKAKCGSQCLPLPFDALEEYYGIDLSHIVQQVSGK